LVSSGPTRTLNTCRGLPGRLTKQGDRFASPTSVFGLGQGSIDWFHRSMDEFRRKAGLWGWGPAQVFVCPRATSPTPSFPNRKQKLLALFPPPQTPQVEPPLWSLPVSGLRLLRSSFFSPLKFPSSPGPHRNLSISLLVLPYHNVFCFGGVPFRCIYFL